MKLVMVEWYDACSGLSWESRGNCEHTQLIVSFGIIVREDDNEIELVPDVSPSHKLHQIAIPKGAIKRIRKLNVKSI